jgi:sporulation protein YlmC with PRC-barrel domain
MFRTTLLTAVAAAALSATAAIAAPGGAPGAPTGGGTGHSGDAAGIGGGAGGLGGGPAGAALDARMNSMGAANASSTGIDNANANSALNTSGTTTLRGSAADRMFPGTTATGRVTSGTLAGLATGMTLMSNGTAVGTVQQIRTAGNGSVVLVVVQGTNGRLFPIPASKLSLTNGVLTTTARLNGINGGNVAFANPAAGVSQGPMHASPTGIAHANSRSVLAAGAVASTALPGLATGMTVQTSTGTMLGTVTQIVTGTDGTIRMVIVTSSTGQTFRLSPSSLTISGGVLTTTQIGG